MKKSLPFHPLKRDAGQVQLCQLNIMIIVAANVPLNIVREATSIESTGEERERERGLS